jgi:hypothetical protein
LDIGGVVQQRAQHRLRLQPHPFGDVGDRHIRPERLADLDHQEALAAGLAELDAGNIGGLVSHACVSRYGAGGSPAVSKSNEFRVVAKLPIVVANA